MPIRIAIIDDYEGFVPGLQAYRDLCAALPEAEVRVVCSQPLSDDDVRGLADVDYLVLVRERTRVDAALLARLPALKGVVQTGRVTPGPTAHVDLAACAARGVVLLEGSGSGGHSAAELTWALVLNASRNVYPYMRSFQEGRWQQGAQPRRLGRSLHGLTLGILGYGRIGRIVGGYGKAFGMRVLAWGREQSRIAAQEDGVEMAASREALFAESDVLALQLKLSEQTRHSVRAQDLALMKPDALLVNTSRPGLIEPGALEQALKLGRPGQAALDVHDPEPLTDPAGIAALSGCVVTPHIGYVERNGYELLFGGAFQALLAHLRGQSAAG